MLMGGIEMFLTGMGWHHVYTDLSANPKYVTMIGREFRTKSELLLFRYSDNKKNIAFFFHKMISFFKPIKLIQIKAYPSL